MLRDKAFRIGTITKTHGVHGQLSVVSENKISEPDKWPEWVFLDIDGGLVPFRTDPDEMIWRDHRQIVVGLIDYKNQDDVLRFIGYELWFPNEYKGIIVGSEKKESPFLGFILMDATGRKLGKIEEYIDLPNNPLFKIIINDEEVLVPSREEWIIEVDENGRRIIMDLPDGLVDMA